MLLALCSKNNEEDVIETFCAHPEFPLRLEDFAARRMNWDSKGANLPALAAELNLGLESVIFVDDNPKECLEAQSAAPAILALALPARAEEIPDFLAHVWAFDRPRVTAEDLRRAEQYAQNAARHGAAQSAAAIEPYLAQPFAFLGHSLGAIVAVELARELRRRNLTLPRRLIVCAARAPQFRRNHVPPPEPSDEDLLREVNLPDYAAIRHAVLPALRADTHLYRRYVYSEDAPLPAPIRAYGGLDDPHISLAHLEALREQTTESFALRQFPGGHFYLKEHRVAFDAALHEDL